MPHLWFYACSYTCDGIPNIAIGESHKFDLHLLTASQASFHLQQI